MMYKRKPLKSAGSDDVFVTNIATEDGTVEWMQQIGSSGKEVRTRSREML